MGTSHVYDADNKEKSFSNNLLIFQRVFVLLKFWEISIVVIQIHYADWKDEYCPRLLSI